MSIDYERKEEILGSSVEIGTKEVYAKHIVGAIENYAKNRLPGTIRTITQSMIKEYVVGEMEEGFSDKLFKSALEEMVEGDAIGQLKRQKKNLGNYKYYLK